MKLTARNVLRLMKDPSKWELTGRINDEVYCKEADLRFYLSCHGVAFRRMGGSEVVYEPGMFMFLFFHYPTWRLGKALGYKK